ncbi:adaptor protein MecA [Solibacillus sp. FSL H8-0538]|uniref:adaptor protein MecA n=1 Tax=Solibacillus sp. FSL H8-0538 TaxID=2921400 RepID=UPI0030FB1242
MDIERINENTLKLFITYSDIEDRGYSREEIWYNRSKGEELFWDVIGEVNTDDYFDLDGPIWIHINASDVGLEVVVTRANINTESDASAMMQSFEENRDMADQLNGMEDALYNTYGKDLKEEAQIVNGRFCFKDIDELIPLAKRAAPLGLKSSLYKFENYYYLFVDFQHIENNEEVKNLMALFKEYLPTSKVTVHRLIEYGEVIIAEDCFETILTYFS